MKRDQSPWELLGEISQIFKFREFWRTRRAILEGDPLYLMPYREIKENGYMGPWTFNFYESFLAGFPASFVSGLIGIVSTHSYLDRSGEILAKLLSIVNPFIYPFVLMFLADLAARSSLKPRDRWPRNIAVAKNAYLYIEGAYGLFLEMSSIALIFLSIPALVLFFYSSILILLGIAAFVIILFYIVKIGFLNLEFIWFRLPESLFRINGYISADEQLRLSIESRQNITPPWRQYRLRFIIFGGILAGLIVKGIHLFCAAISIVLANAFP